MGSITLDTLYTCGDPLVAPLVTVFRVMVEVLMNW